MRCITRAVKRPTRFVLAILAIQAHARRVAAGADDPATRYYIAAVYALRGDVAHTREHLALPMKRLPAFTKWRLARDIDFANVRDQVGARD